MGWSSNELQIVLAGDAGERRARIGLFPKSGRALRFPPLQFKPMEFASLLLHPIELLLVVRAPEKVASESTLVAVLFDQDDAPQTLPFRGGLGAQMAEEGIHATIGIAQLPSDARTWIDA